MTTKRAHAPCKPNLTREIAPLAAIARETGDWRAVDEAFGGDVDFAQIIKTYGKDERADERKYSPATCTGMEKIVVWGSPNLDTANTSYVNAKTCRCAWGCAGSRG